MVTPAAITAGQERLEEELGSAAVAIDLASRKNPGNAQSANHVYSGPSKKYNW